MLEELLIYLSCPFCGDELEIERIICKEEDHFYGLLTCIECKTVYPVVEGIPIMMSGEKRLNVYAQTSKNSVIKKGMSIREIVRALNNENVEKIKESVVYSIPYQIYTLPKWANIVGNFGKRIIRKFMRSSIFDKKWVEYVKNILENG